jgi:hypothetical protein
MDANLVKKAVQEVLTRIQSGQKLKCPELVDTLKPIKDLEKFDSPMSLLATGMIGRKLDLKIQPKTNVFGDKSGLFTIKKTVELLCKLADEQKKPEPAKV